MIFTVLWPEFTDHLEIMFQHIFLMPKTCTNAWSPPLPSVSNASNLNWTATTQKLPH